jgi:hypothetical protein
LIVVGTPVLSMLTRIDYVDYPSIAFPSDRLSVGDLKRLHPALFDPKGPPPPDFDDAALRRQLLGAGAGPSRPPEPDGVTPRFVKNCTLRAEVVPPISLQGKEKRPADVLAENSDFWPFGAATPPTAVLQSA